MAKFKMVLKQNIVLILLAVMLCPNITAEAKQLEKENTDSQIIVIDPSCQKKADKAKEPLGPGAFKTTLAATTGVEGVKTKYPEYEMNLQIALKLKDILKEQGYTVYLTRNTNDVDLCYSDRAMIANAKEADLFIIIGGGAKTGVSVKCQSEDNPYIYGNYNDCRLLADTILGSVIQDTACANLGVEENDEYAAINWSAVTTAIVEVGSLEDEKEEAKLVTDEYQQKLAQGIADGIESYYSQR